MPYNYNTCIKRMENFEEFVHYKHNMSGGINPYLKEKYINLIKQYAYHYSIYSYNTLICFVNYKDKTYSINPVKYSRTTSKQVWCIIKAARTWERNGYRRILWI